MGGSWVGHRWVTASPVCAVQGQRQLSSAHDGTEEEIVGMTGIDETTEAALETREGECR